MSSLFERWSPEYALNKAFDDMRESGLDKLSECDWTIKDVMKGSESSKAIIGFEYQDMMAGTIELKMIKEGSIWKIDSLAMPKFDKFTLPQDNADQPAES